MQLKKSPRLPPFSSTISGDSAQHLNKCPLSLFKTKDVPAQELCIKTNCCLLVCARPGVLEEERGFHGCQGITAGDVLCQKGG